MKSNFLTGLLLLSAVLMLSACSATLLGNIKRTGEAPMLRGDDYGKMEFVSKGNDLDLKVIFPNGAVCPGKFRLEKAESSYIVFGEKQLIYSGQWDPGQSAACNEALTNPGNKTREIIIKEATVLTGKRIMIICNEAPGGIFCNDVRVYLFKE